MKAKGKTAEVGAVLSQAKNLYHKDTKDEG